MKLPHWLAAPVDTTPAQRRNFRLAYADGLGVGLAMSSGAFLSVFLARLGATSAQVGLLTALPGIAGIALSIIAGRFLQSRRDIVPWFAALRVLQMLGYTFTGLVTFFVPQSQAVVAILWVWALVSIPQTMQSITFSVVMNGVAGPKGRYALMSRRWSIIGIVQSVCIALTGWLLDRTVFPTNYQFMFIVLSLGGIFAGVMGSRIRLPSVESPLRRPGVPFREHLQETLDLVRNNPAFLRFLSKRVVYSGAAMLVAPILPLYYVRTIQASDSWIGLFSTVQTAVMLVGYSFWASMSRKKGARFVLLASTLGMSCWPFLVGITRSEPLLALVAAWAGIFQSGMNLVFFDELMKTVPSESAPTFVSVNQTVLHLATVMSPMVGTYLGDHIGLATVLMISAALRLVAFVLFLFSKPGKIIHFRAA